MKHGKRAVAEREALMQMLDTQQVTVWTRLAFKLPRVLVGNHDIPPAADSAIHAVVPICGRCRLSEKFREFTFLFLVFAFICLVIGLYAAAQYGQRGLTNILAFVFFWGIPVIGVILTALFTGSGVAPVRRSRRSADRKYLIVPVHPTFAERFASAPTSD
ncbi:hypothetical protein [Nocardia callitridis]|uniref:hypothetical protein n=1 Tax=Nocardia callitridis TaxID=648753 RepID=UPI0031F0E90C